MNAIKKIIFIIIIGGFSLSCSNTEYKNAIPKNAKTVIAIDLKQLADNFEMPDELTKQIEPLLGILVSGSDSDELLEMIKGDKETGIDFSSPFYLYQTADNYFGATFKVDDDDNLDDFFKILQRQNFIKKPVEKDGLNWSLLLDDISMAYDDNTLSLFVGENISQAKKTQRLMFDSDEDGSFVGTEKFNKLESKDGAVRCIYNLDAFANYDERSDNEYLNTIKAFLPDGVRPVDVDVIGDLVLNKGIINFNFEVFSPLKKTQKLLENEDDKFRKISGDYIGAPNDFTCWMSMGVNGEDFVKKIKNFDAAKEILFGLERGIDIEKILKSIKGDMAVMLPATSEKMEFVMSAKLKNTDFLKDVSYWNETMKDYGMSMTETTKNNYILHTGDYDLNWGVDDKNLYFASSNSFFRSAFSEKSDKLKAVEKDIKNSIFYAYFNMVSHFSDKYFQGESERINLIDYIAFRAENYRNFSLSIVLKNKDKGLFEQMCDIILDSLKDNLH